MLVWLCAHYLKAFTRNSFQFYALLKLLFFYTYFPVHLYGEVLNASACLLVRFLWCVSCVADYLWVCMYAAHLIFWYTCLILLDFCALLCNVMLIYILPCWCVSLIVHMFLYSLMLDQYVIRWYALCMVVYLQFCGGLLHCSFCSCAFESAPVLRRFSTCSHHFFFCVPISCLLMCCYSCGILYRILNCFWVYVLL